MKTRSLFLLVPVAAAALAYLTWEPDDPGASAESTRAKDLPASAATEATRETAAEPAAALNPAQVTARAGEKGCEIVTHYLPASDGTVLELVACERSEPIEQHAYESYSSDALESLSYADAKAAEILGMRLRKLDQAKALSLILRSSALSGGDIAPILRYSQAYPEPSAIDGEPVRKTIHAKYVLSVVADLLSPDAQYAAPWEIQIRRYSRDADREIALLQARAHEMVAEMRQIELDVTGSLTIGGKDDA